MQGRGKTRLKTIRSLKSRVLTRLVYFNALRDYVLTHVTRSSHRVLYTAHTGRMVFYACIIYDIWILRANFCKYSTKKKFYNGLFAHFQRILLDARCRVSVNKINSSIITEALFWLS